MLNEKGPPEEMGDSRTETGKTEDEPEQLVPGKARKLLKNDGNMSKGHKAYVRELLLSKFGTIRASK